MPTNKTAVHDARDQAINLPVRLSVLAISRSVEDLAFLDDRFKAARWKLYIAHTYREALAQLGRLRVPVVLSEWKLPDGNWKDVLGQLAPMIERPRLIVFSRNADNRLWEEVLNLGACDLLITPFREHELVFAIGSAWLDWEGEQEDHQSRKHAHG
jgi:DNA-binding response OmpR family regulator